MSLPHATGIAVCLTAAAAGRSCVPGWAQHCCALFLNCLSRPSHPALRHPMFTRLRPAMLLLMPRWDAASYNQLLPCHCTVHIPLLVTYFVLAICSMLPAGHAVQSSFSPQPCPQADVPMLLRPSCLWWMSRVSVGGHALQPALCRAPQMIWWLPQRCTSPTSLPLTMPSP